MPPELVKGEGRMRLMEGTKVTFTCIGVHLEGLSRTFPPNTHQHYTKEKIWKFDIG